MTAPICALCANPVGVGIYDVPVLAGCHQWIPLCEVHKPDKQDPVVRPQDIRAIIRASVCWCELADRGLMVVWCPSHGYLEHPTAQWVPWQPNRKE